MSNRNDGGHAFPGHEIDDMRGHGGEKTFLPVGGMSLRDYFAAKAMPIVFGGEAENEARGYEGWREELAREAYRYADAMLKAREQ